MMINDRVLQAQHKYTDETRMWVALRRAGIEDLTPERVTEVLGRYNSQIVQDVLDLWSNFDLQLDPDLASGDVNQILGEQVVNTAANAKDAARNLTYGEGKLQDAWYTTWSTLDNTMNGERHDRPGWTSEIQNMDEFTAMLPEVAATADYITRLRDPATRNSATYTQVHDAISFAKNLSSNINASKNLFDRLRESGVDPAPLEGVLREQLDKHGLADLLSMDAYPPPELRGQADKSLLEFRNAQDTGKPAEKESLDLIGKIGQHLGMSNSAMAHQTYASVIGQVLDYQRAHGGISPKLGQAVQGAAANDRFGFMHDTLVGLELDVAVHNGDAEQVSDLSGGKQALVVWDGDTTLSPDLIADDRSGTNGEQSVVADIMFREGMGEITPNVAAALNSMYAAFGGGIHRTDNNITEANAAAAQRWKQEADQWRNNGGSADDRTPEQVTGVYTGPENLLVVADATFGEDVGSTTNTVTHELGHALDSMLGDVTGNGAYYSNNDPEYAAFRTRLMEISSYGDTPDDTVLNWYFRNQSEGSSQHNGYSGTTESWAQTYAAYAAMRRMMGENEGVDEAAWKRSVFAKGGQSLQYGHNGTARVAGLSMRDGYLKAQEAGEAIWDFFDDFENRRLPEIMKTQVAVKKRIPAPSAVSTALGAPPVSGEQHLPNAVQVERASKHVSERHGSLNMVEIKPGDQNWDSTIASMKEKNPDFTGPSADALSVWYNRDWASQDATLLMKVIMPGNDTPTNIYDYKHSKTGNAQKFQREKALHRVHAQLREKALSEAMDSPVAALVATLIETGMRVDNDKGRNRTKSKVRKRLEQVIGGTSLMPKHLTFNKDSTRFSFMGKSGIDNSYVIKDPRLSAALQKWSQGKNRNDFIFGDITADQSIDYLRQATGIPDLINHDLRTYVATNAARQFLTTLVAYKKKGSKGTRPVRPKKGMNAAEFEKFKISVWKAAGQRINDGWATARDHYVSPAVWFDLEDELGLPHSFDELVNFTGVPAHPGATQPAAPIAAAAAAAEDDPDLVSRPDQIDYSPEAVRDRDEFYDSFEWAGVSPTAPPPPLPPGSIPAGDEEE